MDRLRQPGPCVVKSNDGFPLGWTQVRTANMFMSAVGRPIARRRACSRLFGNLSMFPRPKQPLPTGRSSVGLQTPDEPLEGRSLADERLFGEVEGEGGGRSRNLTLLQVASLRQRYASVCMRIMIILSYGVVMFVRFQRCRLAGSGPRAKITLPPRSLFTVPTNLPRCLAAARRSSRTTGCLRSICGAGTW